MIKLTHQKVREILNLGVFNQASSLDDLDQAIEAFGLLKGVVGSDEYNALVGAAFEVYCEFFLKRYQDNPLLGIQNVKDTSLNQFNPGFDFTFEDFSGNPGLIQTKWRSNPTHKFTSADLGTFANKLRKQRILDENAVFFTNLTHKKYKDSIFHYSWSEDADDMYRVIDRIAQDAHVSRDPKFFDDLRASLELSREVEYVEMPTLRTHQTEVHEGVISILKQAEGRANFIVATGGGKTLNEIKAIDEGFQFYNFQAQVFVAPTINLLLQHHTDFNKYGILRNISVKHIRTGDDVKDADLIDDYDKTTSKAQIIEHLEKSKSLKTLFFVTYASLPKFIEAVCETEIQFDDSVFDEFHHAVKQGTQEDGKTDYKQLLKNFPSKRMLFFSASVKRGRHLSADDEEIFGQKLADVTYARLRKAGILVPRLEIRCVRLDTLSHRFASLTKQLKDDAARHDADIKSATAEAAALIVSVKDAGTAFKNVNLITFSKAVANCKTIVISEAVKAELKTDTLLQTIHAGIPAGERADIIDRIKNAGECDSVVCQHSVMKEGIDVTPFNAELLCRNLDVIGLQQAIGRIVRAHPEDTVKVQAGELDPDGDLSGFIKPVARLYIMIDSETQEQFYKFVRDLAFKLQFSGLEKDDYQFSDISDSKHGVDKIEDDWIAPVPTGKIEIPEEALKQMIEQAYVEMQQEAEDWEKEVELSKFKAKTNDEKMENFLNFIMGA